MFALVRTGYHLFALDPQKPHWYTLVATRFSGVREELSRFTDIAVREGPSGTVFDFSRHHPLDHSILRCDDRVTHVRLWWNYSGEEMFTGAVVGTTWRLTLCRLKRHWLLPTLDLDSGIYGSVCAWCASQT